MTGGYVGQTRMMQQTCTQGHRQTVGDRMEAVMDKQETKKKFIRRNAAGVSLTDEQKTSRESTAEGRGELLMLVFLSYGTILCLLITRSISVWFLYSCQS